ncbi:AAA family ATPase [Paraliomyxa miuraensis]|uniref:AAA family ATPase n=1 Tax=Paraliomyxa miuraensis TaxID=376150 RepID=UPI00224E0401|nr:AAA family ATPase [Paraliomyxa miuraensis]MCX4242513.1 AAA family ATPase [Paraliomyxa miuraensis]
MTSTYDHLLHLCRAGAPLLHIASYEWERVRGHVIGLAGDLGLPMHVWSQSRGLLRCSGEGELEAEDEEARDPLELLRSIHAAEEPGIWLLEDVHPFLHETHHEVLRWLRELARLPTSPRKIVVLSTPTPGLPLDLRKEVPTLELPLPGVDDLRVVLEQTATAMGVRATANEALLDAARGLTVMEASLAFGKAAAALGRLDHGAVPLVAHEKERIIKQSEVLEYYPTDASMADVGGLDQLKTWLERRGRAFGAGARDFGLDAPKGVLLLGVQGCGKSLTAKAIAATWQFPLLRFDMGKVFGGIVGQSEANIRTALHVAQALAPCVLWIDEIEKGLAGMGSSSDTDGGTAARVVGTLLTWLQEKRDPVFVVATANRIDMLPPELLRKGRFDEVFFVDLPSQAVREEILRIHLAKKKRTPADYDIADLATRAVGYSGAELEEAVREGLCEAFSEGCELAARHIARALEQTYPLSRTMRDQIEDLRAWARVRARLASAQTPEPLPKDAEGASPPRLRQEATRNPFIPRQSS